MSFLHFIIAFLAVLTAVRSGRGWGDSSSSHRRSSDSSSSSSRNNRYRRRNNNRYDYIIVGGGFSGLYLAMRLGQAFNGEKKIAILESREATSSYLDSGLPFNGLPDNNHACLGGRILDYPYTCDPSVEGCPDSGIIWMGDHAVRMKTNHGNFLLGEELGFVQRESSNSTYGEAQGFIGNDRGYYFSDRSKLIANRYQNEMDRGDIKPNTDNWVDVLEAAITDENIERMCNNEWSHVYSQLAEITGSSSGFELIQACFRFKSVFGTDVDPQGIWEWYDTDVKSDEGWAYYPPTGMSEFIRVMYQIIIANDYADIYCANKVTSITSQNNYYKVDIKSGNYYYADNIILTVPIEALQEMGRNQDSLVSRITQMTEANMIEPVPTFTCSQQFETDWYTNKIPVNLNDEEQGTITNVDTWYTKENCMGQIENFNSPYIRSGNLIRSMYVDRPRCTSLWNSIYSNTDENKLESVMSNLIRERHAEFFGVNKTDIPEAIKTHCEYSTHGWHYIKATANNNLGNNPGKIIEEWAHKPLNAYNIFMCGETYANRRAWSDGARAHCDILLNEYLNVNSNYLPQYQFSLHERAECSALCNNVSNQQVCNEFPDGAILKH